MPASIAADAVVDWQTDQFRRYMYWLYVDGENVGALLKHNSSGWWLSVAADVHTIKLDLDMTEQEAKAMALAIWRMQ